MQHRLIYVASCGLFSARAPETGTEKRNEEVIQYYL